MGHIFLSNPMLMAQESYDVHVNSEPYQIKLTQMSFFDKLLLHVSFDINIIIYIVLKKI